MKGSVIIYAVLCLQWLTYSAEVRVLVSNFTELSEDGENATQPWNIADVDRVVTEEDTNSINSTTTTTATPVEATTENDDDDDRFCGAILCGSGRECLRQEGAPPTCVCKTSCPNRLKVICGSDGVTYENHCFLHRAACVQNIKIHISSDGPCPGYYEENEEGVEGTEQTNMIEDQEEDPKPLVCYQIERDQLRQLLIDWLKGKVEAAGWFTRGRSYFEVLTDSFRDCDRSDDDKLDAMEFMECVERDEARHNKKQQDDGHVLRGLCVDALIVMSDRDADWELDLEEFRNCLDPEIEPPKKQCSLEDKTYEDGAEVRVDCNICICACGNWVCTASSCNGLEEDPFEFYGIEQGQLPTKEERQRLLQGFIAAEHVNLERIELEVPANDSHGFNDVPRPHGNHNGHHGHGHIGHEIPNEDQDEETDITHEDEYYYYYEGEIPDWAKEYYAEYEDELEEKIEETRQEDIDYYEHHENVNEHVHDHTVNRNTESQDVNDESEDDLAREQETELQWESDQQEVTSQEEEEEEEIHERQSLTSAEVVVTPTAESVDDDGETDFEAEALIPTQEHHPRVNVTVTESSVTLTVSREETRGGATGQHHHGDHTHYRQHHNPENQTVTQQDRPTTNTTILDALLAQYFPEEIEIPHMHNFSYVPETDDLSAETDQDSESEEHEEETQEQPIATTRKPRRHKKKKTTPQVAVLSRRLATTTAPERTDQEQEEVVTHAEERINPTTEVEVTKSILGGRVDITVQHLGTEVIRQGVVQEPILDVPVQVEEVRPEVQRNARNRETVGRREKTPRHHRNKKHKKRQNRRQQGHGVMH